MVLEACALPVGLVDVYSCTLPIHDGTVEMANVAEAFTFSAFSMCRVSVGYCCYAFIDVCGYSYMCCTFGDAR